jgi:hypothetical protein
VSQEIEQSNENRNLHYARLFTATHYEATFPEDKGSRTEQVWINEADELEKISVTRTTSSGRESTGYFYDADRIIAVEIDRTKKLDDGAESEQGVKISYGSGGVWQMAVTPWVQLSDIPGAALKLSPLAEGKGVINNTALGLPDPTFSIAQPGIHALDVMKNVLKAGPPKFDPTRGEDGPRYRLIMDSVSPDGRYALAFGLDREKIDWAQYRDRKGGGYVLKLDTEGERKAIRNYVVDLQAHKILGETGCHYSRTRAQDDEPSHEHNPDAYDHECLVAWSMGNDCNFVQVVWDKNGEKINSECRLGRIADGRLLATVDLREPAAKLARSLAAKKGWKPQKDNRSYEVELNSYKLVTVEQETVTLRMTVGEDDIEEAFAIAAKKDTLILTPKSYSKEIISEKGTPYFAQTRSASEQELIDKKKALLDEEARLLMEEEKDAKKPK